MQTRNLKKRRAEGGGPITEGDSQPSTQHPQPLLDRKARGLRCSRTAGVSKLGGSARVGPGIGTCRGQPPPKGPLEHRQAAAAGPGRRLMKHLPIFQKRPEAPGSPQTQARQSGQVGSTSRESPRKSRRMTAVFPKPADQRPADRAEDTRCSTGTAGGSTRGGV